MDFDAKQFLASRFEARTESVPVPALREWFSGLAEDEVPAFTVRGLTGAELARAEEAATKGRAATTAILDTLRKAQRLEGIDELERALGVDEKVPVQYALKMEHVVTGTVSPPLTLQLAVKLSIVAPVELLMLHLKITELTGKGQVALKKPEASGTDPTSEEHF